MAVPSVTYKNFIENVRDELAGEFTSTKVITCIAPYAKPYNQEALYVMPCEDGIWYGDSEGFNKTHRARYIWYKTRILGLVALTDANFEGVILGTTSKDGIVKILENAFEHMSENFMSLSGLREARVEWDNPPFYPAALEGEPVNFYVAAGSFIYLAKLKLITAIEMQATPPGFSNIQSEVTGTDTATITWDTNKPATTWLKYGKTSNAFEFDEETTETSVYVESHTVYLTGLDSGTTYYFKPWGNSKNDWYGKAQDIHSFETESAAPVLTDGPYATPGLTTCQITWTTNVAAYHRTRHRKIGTDDWIVSDWSPEASTEASVDLSNLDPERWLHYYDIQSCLVGDGSAAFDWYPGDNSKYFYTTCSLPIVYYDFDVGKGGIPGYEYLKLSWKTQADRKNDEARWKIEPYGGWNYLDRTSSRNTLHYCADYGFRFENGSYAWQCRNTTMCNEQGDWSEEQGFLYYNGNFYIV